MKPQIFEYACVVQVERNELENLIQFLEELGYKPFGNPFQQSFCGKVYTTIDGYYVAYRCSIDKSWIDCEKNLTAFKELVTKRYNG